MTIDISKLPLNRLRRSLAAADRAWKRAIDDLDGSTAESLSNLRREIAAEIETREATNG